MLLIRKAVYNLVRLLFPVIYRASKFVVLIFTAALLLMLGLNRPSQVHKTGLAVQLSEDTPESNDEPPDPGTSSYLLQNSVPASAAPHITTQAPPFESASLPDTVAALDGLDLTRPADRALAVARLAEIDDHRFEITHARAIANNVPLRIEGPGDRLAELHSFRPDGTPLYKVTHNCNAAISTGANLLQSTPYNLDGAGLRAGVWDGGSVLATHREFSGRVRLRNSSSASDDHATHVAGTMAAVGVDSLARGMAPALAIDSYDWTNDYAEMTAAGAAAPGEATTKLPISNHSYGYWSTTSDMGRYEREARAVDALTYALPYYLSFWSAGNDQGDLPSLGGYQTITHTALAKNIVTVGAVNDAVSAGLRVPAQGTMSSFSSWGPADDGRIKPDLVANGVGVWSTIKTDNSAYSSMSGTSMSSPSAAGSASLVAQLYLREFSILPRSSTLKALLIHTADDLGRAGPDYQFGWGLLNAQAAADLVLAHKNSLASPKIIEGTITTATKTLNHAFTWNGLDPIRATLVWLDPAGTAQTAPDSRVPNLVNNLDLVVVGPDGTSLYQPFTMPFVGTWTQNAMTQPALRGKNNVDNVEQVLIEAPGQSGTYTVRVSLDGSLSGTAQTYALIVTGGTDEPANPPPSVRLVAPEGVNTLLGGTSVMLIAEASDTDLRGQPGTVVKVEFLANDQVVGTTTNPPYAVQWTPASSGPYSVYARAYDLEGATSISSSAVVQVLVGAGTPVIDTFTPTSGASGNVVTIDGQNFADITLVEIGGVAASFTVQGLDRIEAIVPAGAATGPLRVVGQRGVATTVTPFEVLKSALLISQIYPGASLTGSPYRSDYVELKNRTSGAVNISGWSLQYATASGLAWTVAPLAGVVPANGRYLIVLNTGSVGQTIPSGDSVHPSINLSSTSGKIALVNRTQELSGSSPIGQLGLMDFVGYGFSNAALGSPAASPPTTSALTRAAGGVSDNGDNSKDFVLAPPAPRNSAGVPAFPVIQSTLTVQAWKGQSFNYQIIATGEPTTFSAGALPPGLALNTATGRISGILAATGTSQISLQATNAAGTGAATLILGVSGSLLQENFTAIVLGNSTSTSGSQTAWTGSTNFPTVSAGYQALGCVRLGTNSTPGFITSRAIDLSSGGGSFTISFKVKGWSTVEGDILVDITGQTQRRVPYSATMSDAFEPIKLTYVGGRAGSAITLATSRQRAFVDDVVIDVAPAPEVEITGELAPLTTEYGTPSATRAITVSGRNLIDAVIVSAPTGFEVGPAAGAPGAFAPTQTLIANGALGPTTLPVRFAAGSGPSLYSGEITATSQGSSTATSGTVFVTVKPRPVAVTAADRFKPYGESLTLGASAFTSVGLADGDAIESVILIAIDGASAAALPGRYAITPSAATGPLFTPSNYVVDYQPGTLTVLGQTYEGWISARFTGANTQPDADPDQDGLNNLLEFFLGMDPASTTAASERPLIRRAGAELHFDYRRSKLQTLYVGTVEWSDRLGTDAFWQSTHIVDEILSDHGEFQWRRARIALPDGHASRRFLRLKVEAASP